MTRLFHPGLPLALPTVRLGGATFAAHAECLRRSGVNHGSSLGCDYQLCLLSQHRRSRPSR